MENTFTFNNKQYKYLIHAYNNASVNERSIEVPIIWDIVQENKDKRVLEIGNVLSHYFDCSHNVIDKYEKDDYKNLENIDVISYKSDPYDLVVSVSTLEHIGWDEYKYGGIKLPEMIFPSFANLRNFCKGKLIWTHPWGYNSFLDKQIVERKVPITDIKGMIRISGSPNLWKEVEWKEVTKKVYGSPFRNANGILIIWTDFSKE